MVMSGCRRLSPTTEAGRRQFAVHHPLTGQPQLSMVMMRMMLVVMMMVMVMILNAPIEASVGFQFEPTLTQLYEQNAKWTLFGPF